MPAPIIKYREIAKRHFDSVPYGDPSSGRIVPTKMNSDIEFKNAYLDSDVLGEVTRTKDRHSKNLTRK
jgi:hypothetical protein